MPKVIESPTLFFTGKVTSAMKYISSLLILLSILLFSACDPGVYYTPSNWTRKDSSWFTKSFGQFDLDLTALGGLSGREFLTPEVIIYNKSQSSIFLESMTLRAGDSKYTAHPPGNNSKWEEIPSHEVRRLALRIEFGKSIHYILRDPVELLLKLKVGDKHTDISIPMTKEPQR